jgi:four helix bundle protein
MTPRPAARTFQDLLVRQKAHEFVMGTYHYSADFPKSETYGLASQFRRAAVLTPSSHV